MSNIKHPNSIEIWVLHHAYNRFYDLYDVFIDPLFWDLPEEFRLLKIKNCFEIYTELLKYPPIKHHLEELKKLRPPSEILIAEDFFTFIRNVLSHFPFFKSWNDIHINKDILIWNNPKNSSTLKFIKKYAGKKEIKYRIWSANHKKMTYISIKFPQKEEHNIYLKNLISEKDGILFCIILMRKILDSQVYID